MNYYERHLGDYARDTAHLSAQEVGHYDLLLDRYYATEGGIPAEMVYAVARARTKPERACVDGVLRQYFYILNGVWMHGKCEEVIARYREKSAKAAASANKRWGCERNANASETHMPTPCEPDANQYPVTSNQKPEEKTARKRATKTPLPEDFGISERVTAWAAEKGHGRLAERLEQFVGYVRRAGKTYADWDEALMCAIREDWAKFNGQSAPVAFVPRPKHKCVRCEAGCDGIEFKGNRYCGTCYGQLQADSRGADLKKLLEQRSAA